MMQVGIILGILATGCRKTMQNPVFYAAASTPANSAGKSNPAWNGHCIVKLQQNLPRRPAIETIPP
jgi:hypothetical protein